MQGGELTVGDCGATGAVGTHAICSLVTYLIRYRSFSDRLLVVTGIFSGERTHQEHRVWAVCRVGAGECYGGGSVSTHATCSCEPLECFWRYSWLTARVPLHYGII